MNKGHLPIARVLRLAILLLTGLTSACSAQSMGGPRVWIDAPTIGARLSVGQAIDIHSHAYAREGVAEVMLVVNGVPYRRDPPSEPGASFTDISQSWLAEHPGQYTLQVMAFDTTGEASSPAIAWVTVGEAATATPTLAAPPTLTSTPTSTPPSPVQATFWADRTSLTRGECTTLHWDTQNAVTVTLDGVSVTPQGTGDVCPQETVTYLLQATAPHGSAEQSVAIAVSAPSDTSGPSIATVSHSPGSIWDGSACGPTSVTISASVSDPTGVAEVELHYRVVKGTEQGQWRVVTMSRAGGDTFRAILGPTELSASLVLYGGGVVEYSITARDGNGNLSQSGTFTLEAKLCFG